MSRTHQIHSLTHSRTIPRCLYHILILFPLCCSSNQFLFQQIKGKSQESKHENSLRIEQFFTCDDDFGSPTHCFVIKLGNSFLFCSSAIYISGSASHLSIASPLPFFVRLFLSYFHSLVYTTIHNSRLSFPKAFNLNRGDSKGECCRAFMHQHTFSLSLTHAHTQTCSK